MLGEEGVVEDDIKFSRACCYGGTCFPQLVGRVLGSFVEAFNAGYELVGAFEVGVTALDIVQANTDRLRILLAWVFLGSGEM